LANFRIGRKIGNGAYGTVHEAFRVSTGEKLAVKIISFDRDSYEAVKSEAWICQQLQHENIARVYDVIEVENRVFIFMEFCENGELFEYIKKNGPLGEELAARIFLQLHSAVRYLHLKKIAHRDIKSENVLLTAQMNPKLIDFGLSKEYSVMSPMMETFCGSPSYVAPEIIKKLKYSGEKVDVWSLGVTLYIMLEAAEPFFSKSNSETKSKITSLQWSVPTHSSKLAIELYELIFIAAPVRITLAAMPNTAFFEKYGGKRGRFESRSTQKTERMSTGEGVELVLPEIGARRKEASSWMKVFLNSELKERNEQKAAYNSILSRQSK
jgi:serine/threonine protein kinase